MENKPAYSLIFSGKAEKEIITSFDWYEAQQKGLGEKFTKNVSHTIDAIEQNPELFSFRHKHYREAVIRTFPFVIIYRINEKKKTINIMSVFHTAQNPKKKY